MSCLNLFREVFTHLGSGTLFSEDYSNVFRQASLSDARDIALLMRPYIRSGAVLPINEDDVAGNINSYFLYSVNEQVVAAARLIDYGKAYEIGKLVTLPRYQRKGRARKLIKQLLEKAAADGKEYIFSLTTEERMGDFFESCGLKEIDRSQLPADWKTGYDLKRPSRAYCKKF